MTKSLEKAISLVATQSLYKITELVINGYQVVLNKVSRPGKAEGQFDVIKTRSENIQRRETRHSTSGETEDDLWAVDVPYTATNKSNQEVFLLKPCQSIPLQPIYKARAYSRHCYSAEAVFLQKSTIPSL